MSLNPINHCNDIISSVLKEFNENRMMPRQQRLQIALRALEEIKNFATAHLSQPLHGQVTPRDLFQLTSQLDAIQKIALSVGSPLASPHKMRRSEKEQPHHEISQQIQNVKQMMFASNLMALNDNLSAITNHLHSAAEKHSNAIKQIIKDHSSVPFTQQGYVHTINQIILNLRGLEKELIQTSSHGFELATHWAANIDPKLYSSKDLEEFQKRIIELITEYNKIAESLEFFQQQNDLVSTTLSKFDLFKIEPFEQINHEGDPLEVLEVYKRMILICKDQIENYKNQNKPEHILPIMNAYSNLQHYLSEKERMVQEKWEAGKAYQEELQKKYEEETDPDTKLNYKAELEFQEQVTNAFMIAAKDPIYQKARELMTPIELKLQHWLFPRIQVKSQEGLKNILESYLLKGFKSYDTAIQKFRDHMKLVKGQAAENASIKPFIQLHDKILNIRIPVPPRRDTIPKVTPPNVRPKPYSKGVE